MTLKMRWWHGSLPVSLALFTADLTLEIIKIAGGGGYLLLALSGDG